MKASPELATALKNPNVNKAFTEVAKQPGFFQSLKSNVKLNRLAGVLRRRPTEFTSRQVTNVGHLAVTTSSSGAWAKVWVKYGAIFLFVVGIIFLFKMVFRAKS
ncbi:hypothetical protein GN244_ATG02093 [Phytophthora infestans]|uniref:Secreted RxLR effector peptide protein n=1 Tax=Phytophthora infestans TaxID=4787 RepID=A0A833TLY6_PHYIN|nr:hypothetical protein GN244_ATG02093 [Phytophthora infestans]